MKHYILSMPSAGWQAEFDIDLLKGAPACKESLDFFGDPITREDDSNEECVRAWLRFWAPLIAKLSMTHGHNDGSPCQMITALANLEGMPPVDGSQGILLSYCDRFEFDSEEFDIASEKEAP